MIADLFKQLGIDQTLWTQIGVFVFFYAWVRFVFFPPFLKLINEREARTTGLSNESESLSKLVQEKEAELGAKMAEAKRAASAERERIIGQAKSSAHVVLDNARKEAKKKIETARASAEAELSSEAVNLRKFSQALSEAIVSKLTKEGAQK